MKWIALITTSGMLLGSYALAVLRRRLGVLLEGWSHEAVDGLPAPVPVSSD